MEGARPGAPAHSLRRLTAEEGALLSALGETLLPGASAAGIAADVDEQLGRANPLFALRLGRAGKKVVVLEAGPERRLNDLYSSQIWARRLRWSGPPTETTGKDPLSVNFNSGWGGGGAALANPLVLHLPAARAAGAEFRYDCFASRVLANPAGDRATGVEYFDAEGRPHTLAAGQVVLATFAFQNARLLLNSRTEARPEGLALALRTLRYLLESWSRLA